jgi:hypothetical protein
MTTQAKKRKNNKNGIIKVKKSIWVKAGADEYKNLLTKACFIQISLDPHPFHTVQ